MKKYFKPVLHLWRKYGRKNDSLEFTFKAMGNRIDLFWMYEGVDPPKNKVVPSGKDQRYNWMGLQTFDNYKKVRLLVADTRLHLAVSVGTSVRRYVRNIFELRAVFALRPLPNRPRLSCRVSGLVALLLLPNRPRLDCRVSGLVLLKAE